MLFSVKLVSLSTLVGIKIFLEPNLFQLKKKQLYQYKEVPVLKNYSSSLYNFNYF